MKPFNSQIRTHLLIFTLLLTLAGGSTACSLGNLAGNRDLSAARSENQAPRAENSTESSAANAAPEEENSVEDAEGTFYLNNHRPGEEGYENSLIVEKPESGKMRVAFEGTFFYRANGAESFHESSAYGTLTIDGNTARGRLKEEGSDNNCTIELNFTGNERVNLKSSNCDLNVTPDGVYLKGADKTGTLDADVSSRDRSIEDGRVKADEYYDPSIQYDQSGAPNGIVNLMERDGERTGCETDVMNYTGEVKKVDYIGDYVYEFTLLSDNRKPQKISLALSAEDRLPFDDVRSIIKRGNHLEVTFILCGNAGIATPTAIYKR